jgi:ParB family chromosome partitioning protein
MKEKEEKMHLPKVTADNFFMTQEERDAEQLEKVEIISVHTISDFPQHPYRVKDNEEMQDFAENIKENGVIHPVLVRAKDDGTYEMISGHRRKRACELAGITEIPAIVRKMTDEEAVIAMVDSNKQREKVLPSEKAFAYKMKLDAMKKQGKRNDLITSSPLATKLNEKVTAEIIGEEFGDGKDNVYRYIRLTELIPEILDLVDEEKMKLRPAVEISYLKKEEQDYLFETIEYTDAFPSHPQARELRRLSQENKLTEDEIDRIMSIEKPNQKEQIKFKVDKVKGYFPKDYTVEQMQKVIEKLLQKYQLQWQKEIKQKNYDR